MDFGVFLEQMRNGSDQRTAFREVFELADAAEAWGLDIVWLAEMLMNPARSVLSAPLLVASSIVTRTKRLRVGTAVLLLPLNHPLRVAGEIATLDHLSAGRFDFGIGRSGFPRSYDALGVPYLESQERFFEALEIIRRAWQGEPFSHEGKYWRFANIGVAPRPYRTPHPPIRMAATTAETFPRVGTMGLPIFVGLRGMDISTLKHHVRAYRRAWRDAGHAGSGNVYLRIPVYAAATERAAHEEPLESATFYFSRQADLQQTAVGRTGAGPAERLQARVERLAGLSYEQILAERVAFGSAAGLIDRVARLREELTLDGVVAELDAGGLIPAERVKKSLEILTHEVMPAFK